MCCIGIQLGNRNEVTDAMLSFEEEALDCTIRRARFGRDFGPVVRLLHE
jgi:hypothetical protein